MVSTRRFRTVMGRFATGVAIVTARDEAGDCGLTVNSLTSVSLDPPLILVCIDRSARSHDRMLAAGAFAVNVLREGQDSLARRFASSHREGRFAALEAEPGRSGSPLIGAALAHIECTIEATHPGGDHTIVVGRVVEMEADAGEPLLFFDGAYRELAPEVGG